MLDSTDHADGNNGAIRRWVSLYVGSRREINRLTMTLMLADGFPGELSEVSTTAGRTRDGHLILEGRVEADIPLYPEDGQYPEVVSRRLTPYEEAWLIADGLVRSCLDKGLLCVTRTLVSTRTLVGSKPHSRPLIMFASAKHAANIEPVFINELETGCDRLILVNT